MMSTTINPVALRTFVRETLGCQCPDSVFELIDYQEHADIVDRDTITRRLLIGNRLLIYILEPEDENSLSALLPLLVRKAKTERDYHGYTRLRIVIVADPVVSNRAESETLFASIEAVDARVHLHVVGKKTIDSWS